MNDDDHHHIWTIRVVTNGKVAAYRDDRRFRHRTQAYRAVNREVGPSRAMVLKCNGFRCGDGYREKHMELTPPRRDGWPEWATIRSEEIRSDLPPEQWGPWSQGGICRRSPISLEHPSEEPYFFHCRPCLERQRERHRPPRKHDRRDRGLCIKCGNQALEKDHVKSSGPPGCADAEAQGMTVARYSTHRYCQSCKSAQVHTS